MLVLAGECKYDPAMDAINAFNDKVNAKVSGEVTVRLFKGSATVVAMKSPYGLGFSSFNNSAGYDFNVNTSPGFIEVYSLQMRLAKQLEKAQEKKHGSGVKGKKDFVELG